MRTITKTGDTKELYDTLVAWEEYEIQTKHNGNPSFKPKPKWGFLGKRCPKCGKGLEGVNLVPFQEYYYCEKCQYAHYIFRGYFP
jgi:ribosomal protein S27AE